MNDNFLDQLILKENLFDLFGEDVLAALCYDNSLAAARDVQEALAVEISEVSGIEPPVAYSLRGRFRILVIAHHDRRALDDDLAYAVFVLVDYTDLGALDGLADRPGFSVSVAV